MRDGEEARGSRSWGMTARLPPPSPKSYRRTFIREWRKERGLTLEQLGATIEMVPSHLSMLERGQRGYTQETLEAIATALTTDVQSLLSRRPQDSESLWSTWEQANPSERVTISELAQTIVRRRDT